MMQDKLLFVTFFYYILYILLYIYYSVTIHYDIFMFASYPCIRVSSVAVFASISSVGHCSVRCLMALIDAQITPNIKLLTLVYSEGWPRPGAFN